MKLAWARPSKPDSSCGNSSLRGLVRSASLSSSRRDCALQWVAEMATHFGERFQLLIPGDFSDSRRPPARIILAHARSGRLPDGLGQAAGRRRGWSREEVAEYNRERFEDLISAGWDLVIVDEATAWAAASDQVARFSLGQGLGRGSAVPAAAVGHAASGQDRRLPSACFAFLTETLFRSGQRQQGAGPAATSSAPRSGEPSTPTATRFSSRDTPSSAGRLEDATGQQRPLYEAVTEYVREGYNQALARRRATSAS